MRPRVKSALALFAFAVGLATILSMPSEPNLNRVMAWKLMNETDATKRMVLINMSLEFDPQFWNSRYLQCALLAESNYERKFIAALLLERLGTKALVGLRDLVENETSPSARGNGSAILPLLESP